MKAMPAVKRSGAAPARPGKVVRAGRPRLRISRILVPVDFSEPSVKALQYAAAFARQFGARVELLHVLEPMYGAARFRPLIYEHYASITRPVAEEQLNALAAEHGREIRIASSVHLGNAAQVIAEHARKQRTDLIVLATHGYTGLAHLVLGSTAEKVVRQAPCPVLVVREHEHEFI
jgi:universal stress protein A